MVCEHPIGDGPLRSTSHAARQREIAPNRKSAVVACRYRLFRQRDERCLDIVVDAPIQRLELQCLEQRVGADLAAIEIGENG